VSGESRAAAQAALDELMASGAVGAGVVGRDGLPILLKVQRPVQEETFSAMAAAMLGAAEAALLEFGASEPATITVEAGRIRLVLAGLDDQHLLVVAAPVGPQGARVQQGVDAIRTRLRTVLGV
jgi:predicted regulator of Ras-like GTPase activity (Roadblock/LC7/MglB family)